LTRTLLALNPPEHTRVRKAVAASFTTEKVTALTAGIGDAVDTLIDQLELGADEHADMIADFADRLPLAVMGSVLGVSFWPEHDLRQQTMEFNLLLEREVTPEALGRADAAAVQIERCLQTVIDERRSDGAAGLISDLLAATANGDLTESDIIPLVFQMLNAGYQTTASMLGSALNAVLHPDRPALSALRGNPSLTRCVVAEVARTDPPVQTTARHTRTAVTVAGESIPPGQVVVAVLAAANRDPARYERPDDFVASRSPSPILSFGWGLHHCLGAALAMLETEIALARLADRFPEMRMAGRPQRYPTANMRAFKSFPVLLGQPAKAG
jgi:cytochrome P450